jgi:hypothetical protein
MLAGMTVPRLAVLDSSDEQVKALALLLLALCRQHGGELRISTSLIESCHVGHVLEQDYESVAGFTVLRVVELPPDMVHALAVSLRAVADDLGDDTSSSAADGFVVVPHHVR